MAKRNFNGVCLQHQHPLVQQRLQYLALEASADPLILHRHEPTTRRHEAAVPPASVGSQASAPEPLDLSRWGNGEPDLPNMPAPNRLQLRHPAEASAGPWMPQKSPSPVTSTAAASGRSVRWPIDATKPPLGPTIRKTTNHKNYHKSQNNKSQQ